MIIVDTALQAREEEGRPIRVGMVGAGFMGQGLTNQIVNSVPGMRVVGDLQPAAGAGRRRVPLRGARRRSRSTRQNAVRRRDRAPAAPVVDRRSVPALPQPSTST